jgi:hypothetical protein
MGTSFYKVATNLSVGSALKIRLKVSESPPKLVIT